MANSPATHGVPGDGCPGGEEVIIASDFARRIEELPDELLNRILHIVGRPTRRVCWRWLDAYGPLTNGLCLTCIQNINEFRRLTSSHLKRPAATPPAPRFSHVSTLRLEPPFHAAIVPKLPAAFPALHTLHLHTTSGLPARIISSFAPWAPTLTSLTLTHPTDAPAATTLASTLTSLRSLSLLPPNAVHAGPTSLLPTLAALFSATHLRLQSFEWQHLWTRSHEARDVLRPLAGAAPYLTRLVLHGVRLSAWDDASVNTLATAWPSLASAHLHIHPSPLAHDDLLRQALIAALARRTALTSLALNIYGDLPYNALGPLRLRELTLYQDVFVRLFVQV